MYLFVCAALLKAVLRCLRKSGGWEEASCQPTVWCVPYHWVCTLSLDQPTLQCTPYHWTGLLSSV